MKKKILILAALVLTLACVLSLGALTVSAEETEPSVTIAKFNLAFEDNTYLKYAVRFDGVADSAITENNIGMLYWTDYADGFVPGTEDYSSATTGYTDISGVKHYVFEYNKLSAKQLTDYVYSVAYLEYDGETYYSEPVKYSALEYAYNRLGKTNAGSNNAELKALLNNMLAYGASAQQYFDYKEDRLATADFYQLTLVGGTLEDGFTSGLYLSTDEVTITAPEIDGKTFAGWQNANGEIAYAENPATVTNLAANTTLTATYEDSVKYSEGLEFKSNGDGTCYVKSIGTCTDTDIVIPPVAPNGDKVTSIGSDAFFGCTSLKSIVIPDSVTSIGNYAFSKCSNLTTIKLPNTIKIISTGMFSDCSKLYNIDIPDGVLRVESHAFFNCYELKNVTIPNSVTLFGDFVFSQCHNLAHISIPNNVKTLGYYMFYSCDSLESIEMPSNLTTIGNYAFSNCTSLTNISMPNTVTIIGEHAFSNCTALKNISMSDNLTSIGNSSFSKCVNLSYIQIPKTVEHIGYSAFYSCSNLSGKIVIPSKVTTIESGTFSNCGNLTDIEIENGVTEIEYRAFFNCSKLISVAIPESVTNIDYEAFASCHSLINISIPNTVTNIGKGAFSACHSLSNIISIPDGITAIFEYTFANCNKLSDIVIPNTITNIETYSFMYCISLANIYYVGTEQEWDSISITLDNYYLFNATRYYYSENAPTTEGNFWHYVDGVPTPWPEYVAPAEPEGSDGLYLALSDDKTYYIVGGYGSCGDKNVIIPNEYDGIPVTHIASGAFTRADMMGMESVYIPANVTTIESGAFNYCLLKNIEVSENNPAYKSVDSDLYTKDGKTLLVYAAYNYRDTFYVPDGVETIGNYVFMQTSVKNVILSESVTTIEGHAFYWCESLKTVTISKNVKEIADYAFYNSSNITDVYYSGTEEEWAAITIGGSNEPLTNATIHYNYSL